MAPHHRRRRAAAILALTALGVLAAVLLVRAGGVTADRVAGLPDHGFLGGIRALAGSGPASLAGGEAAAENAAINRTLAYTPYVRVAGREHREIALTFDDGPGPYTPQILSVLERHDVPATFFEVGVLERYFYASTAAIVAAGDPIGDHTEVHAPMSRLSPADQRAQLLEQAAAIERHGARFPRLFRPPYGLWNAATLALLHRYHMLMVLWTVDTNDYLRPGVRAIVTAALSGARPGAIILLHDAGGNRSETVAALPQIIAGLRRRHFRLVTVPRLLLDNPPPRMQNIGAVIGAGG
ncbi:MAG: polysaccharide deacetylase family protein [Solirubrobacterales bacterium]|nr:polysaccharide deacetylase family protein [Solirubrobacterales bacterium]MBV9941283.1 polysaccharide deacetylase family protein [Solirubrobacterales bacterium]